MDFIARSNQTYRLTLDLSGFAALLALPGVVLRKQLRTRAGALVYEWCTANTGNSIPGCNGAIASHRQQPSR